MSQLWRPFSVPGARAPLQMSRGAGATVVDGEGRAYLDGVAGLWNVALGLNHAELVARMHAQMQTLTFASLFHGTNPAAELLAARLVALSDGAMASVYLSTTGSTAVEVALRVARLHQRAIGRPLRQRILSFDAGYHGCSGLGLAASGLLAGAAPAADAVAAGVQTIPSPRDEAASLCALAALLADGDVACLIVEPVLGSAGVIVPTNTYCDAVSRLCRQHGALLIADEVATGGGRCGAMYASTLLGLRPDMIALSKGLNSGYFPLGATLFSAAVVAPIARAQLALQFGSTQDGNPVGCVAALATLDLVADYGLELRAQQLGRRLRAALRNSGGAAVIGEVRGLGLMIGIELSHTGSRGAAFNAAESAHARALCQEAGLLVYHFDSGLSLFPALTLTDDEADDITAILHEVLATLS
jgi:adenosylmethionine-8-amino-7-oxononanoate aminotransferase